MARRLRITPTAAAALGPEAVRILQDELGGDGVVDYAASLDALRRATRPGDPGDLPVLRVASERLDRPAALEQ